MKMIKTADEVIASVDATLASWKSAFETSPTKKSALDVVNVDAGGGGTSSSSLTTTTPVNINKSKSQQQPWKDSKDYNRRLSTFKPSTYFAKPLALSPLVCAAYGWENTAKDIIKCCQPNCGATICIAFHPSLNEESHDNLCQKYMDMLVSTHAPTCAFRTFASRCSKVMQKCKFNGYDKAKRTDISVKENKSELLMNKVSNDLSDSKNDFYVPPYFLSLSDDFLRFEDRSGDGSITKDIVKEGALQIRDKLKASIDGGLEFELMVSECITKFCHEAFPDADLDKALCLKESTMRVPYLLSAFGWSPCDDSVGGETAVIVKCNMCQARACLNLSSCSTDEQTPKKRRRIETRNGANIKLIDSHRVYCPYVSGFSFGPRKQSDFPGWKLVVSNLLKSAEHTSITS